MDQSSYMKVKNSFIKVPNQNVHYICTLIASRALNMVLFYILWHACTVWLKMSRRWNITQLWKLFSYNSVRILKISFWNCVSSLLSTSFYLYGSSRFSQNPKTKIYIDKEISAVLVLMLLTESVQFFFFECAIWDKFS